LELNALGTAHATALELACDTACRIVVEAFAAASTAAPSRVRLLKFFLSVHIGGHCSLFAMVDRLVLKTMANDSRDAQISAAKAVFFPNALSTPRSTCNSMRALLSRTSVSSVV